MSCALRGNAFATNSSASGGRGTWRKISRLKVASLVITNRPKSFRQCLSKSKGYKEKKSEKEQDEKDRTFMPRNHSSITFDHF